MNAIPWLLEGRVAEAIGWALFHSLWQGAIIGLLLYVLLKQLTGQSSNVRYLVSCSALALLVILPVLTAFEGLRSTTVYVPYELSASAGVERIQHESATPIIGGAAEAEASQWLERARGIVASSLELIVLAWTLGVVLLSARLLAGWTRLRKLTGENKRAPEHLLRTLNAIADKLEIWKPIRLVQSKAVEVPMVIGWLEPVILLPVTALTGLSPQQLETILAHELAHVRRHDYLVNLGQTLIETLLFYHPATWWISRQVRIERENCCDDLAVKICGSPLVYARALASLEQLRSRNVFGIAASGGSLVSRIRRLASAPESRCTSNWVARLSAVTMAGALLIGAPLATFGFIDAEDGAPSGTTVTVTARGIAADDALPALAADGRSYERDVEGFEDMEDAEDFEGEAASHDSGAVVEPPLIFAELDQLGELFRLEDLANGRVQIALFEIDQEGSEIRDDRATAGARSRRLSVDELIELRRHAVTPEYVESLRAVGLSDLSVEDLAAMAIHGVSADYVRALSASGLTGLDAEEVAALRIHGVTPEMIKALREAVSADLDVEDITKAAIHGLSPKWIAKMTAAGLGREDFDELVSLRIHGVSPELVEEIRALALSDFSIDTVKKMAIHGASPDYVRKMRNAGFTNLDGDELVSFRIHGVTPSFINEMVRLGYSNLDSDDLVSMRIHGVSPSFVDGMARLGYSNLDPEDLVRLRIHGVTEGWVEGLQQAGYTGLTVDELIRLRNAGISMPRERQR
jgi:beta-lactamase regulating signal transducer with metallopeptidase domain